MLSEHKGVTLLVYCPVEGCGLRAEGPHCKILESKKRPVQHEGQEAKQCFYHNHPDRLDWICPTDGCRVKMQKKTYGFCTKHRSQQICQWIPSNMLATEKMDRNPEPVPADALSSRASRASERSAASFGSGLCSFVHSREPTM